MSDFWDGLGDLDWQAIGTLVALVGLIASLRITRSGQKQEREIAENTASRAEAAARLTEDYTRRVVDALERMAATGLGGIGAPHEPKVVWNLVHQAGDMYRLTNTGDADARSVAISGHESMGGLIGTTEADEIQPGEAITFMAAPSMATSDFTITVTWLQPGDGAVTGRWRYPLPMPPL
jgi:hypothetical protein